MAIYDFFVSRNNSVSNTAAYVGHPGRLFYDSNNGVIKLSDGVTPGGTFIPYNIATTTTIGGIKAGPGANVAVDGTLTIDTTGLPLGIGNLSFIDTTISTVNPNQDVIIETNGSGNVSLVGNVFFHPTNGPTLAAPYFKASNDGQITIIVPASDPMAGAVKIVGSDTGQVSPPINSGVMLQLTGNNNNPSRLYNDAIGSFASFVGRRINGNLTVPAAVQAGDEIIRISSTGHNGTAVGGSGSARIVYQAIENFTPTATGGNISLWTCAVGSNTLSKIVTVDSAHGLVATQANILGNLTVTGTILSANGNDIGNPNKRWGNVWLGTKAIHMQDTVNLNDVALQVTNGTLYLNGAQNIALGNLVIQDTTLVTLFPEYHIIMGNIADTGNVQFNRPVQIYDSSSVLRFATNRDGTTTVFTPNIAANTAGALNIVGTTSRYYQPVQFAGGLLHLTANDNQPARLTSDAFGITGGVSTYAQFTGRSGRGNVSVPSALQTNDTMLRITGVGWGTSQFPATAAPTSIEFAAAENYTNTAYGSRINFYTAPLGTSTKTLTMTMTADTGATVYGNVTAANIIVSGNIVGNLTTTTAGINNLNVSGNIAYNAATNNATVTQLTSKSTAVTCNGRTGQITTAASSLAKGAAVTFTVNNSYVTSATDIPVVAFQNGATADSYAVSVTRVQPGSFNITITNNGVGALADTIIINFAIIRVG